MPVHRTAAFALTLTLVCLLTGCPGPSEPALVSADLSHVKVGQKYRYRMIKKGKTLEMVWEVNAITASEVKYSMHTGVGKGPKLDPVEQTWPIPTPSRAGSPTRETLNLGGRSWDCWIRDQAEDKRSTWIPQKNGIATFPPFVKQTTDGKVTTELLAIE